MRAPSSFGALIKFLETLDAASRIRCAQRFGDAMRRCMQAAREAPCVRRGIVERAQQRFIAFRERPSGMKDERLQIALVNPEAVLAANVRAR